ncbi:MAG: hypothetical protein KDD70_01780 [Bdellovibrionales bacterium]|nr:hypothetical protein [Bdellovibrionales bacterium]
MNIETLSAIAIAILIMAALNIDNGLVVDLQIRSLRLPEKAHVLWRSIALLVSAGMRILVLFLISMMAWLNDPQAGWWWLPNRWFADHPETLEWIHLVLFIGGLIVVGMAFWEFYHKWKEELKGPSESDTTPQVSAARIVFVSMYVLFVGLLFSVDSVFTLMSLLDINEEFNSMIVVVLVTAIIMIFGMIPLGKLIQKSLHIKVQMLTVLVVVGAKLMVDGTAGHFSNGILTFIIFVVILNDVGQSVLTKADRLGNEKAALEP